jgi:hypothetical protein
LRDAASSRFQPPDAPAKLMLTEVSSCAKVTSQVRLAACETSAPPTIWHRVPLSPLATDWVLVLLTILFVTLLASGPGKK